VGGTISNNHTLEPYKDLGLDSQKVKEFATKLHVHSVNYAAKLVHTRRALSGAIINSHQETVLPTQIRRQFQVKPANPGPPLICSFFLWWRSFTVLGTKVAPFPY
jgi:hypothetical protein